MKQDLHKSLRIMMVIPSLRSGGAERQLGYLSRGLAALGHEVAVATLSDRDDPPPGWCRDVTLYRLNTGNNYDPRLLLRLFRLIRRIQPEIVQTWNLQTDILGGLAAILNSRRWIIREPNSADPYRSGWQAKLRARLGSKAAGIVSNSAGGDSYWRSLYPDKPRYVVLNSLPFAAIHRVSPVNRRQLGIGAVQKFILCVGRLSRQKRVDRIIAALADLNSKMDAVVFICGEGVELGGLREQVRRLGVEDRVLFRGFLKTETVWALMKSADLFVNLSNFEGMPNTVMEAMACGCPLLVSDIPAHREILDETTACLVDPSDEAAVGKALGEMISEQTVPGRRARASTAREKTRAWSEEDMVRRYEAVYREILSFPPHACPLTGRHEAG